MRYSFRIMVTVALAIMSIVCIHGVSVAAPIGSITGCVRADNGSPIVGAHVVAYNWDTSISAGDTLTDVSGTYSITGLPVGSYGVKARATRYVPETYDEGTDTPVTVTEGNATADINFTLTPGSSISGFVYRDDGATPIPLAHVIVYQDFDGVWVQMGDDLAGTDGSYSVTTGTDSGSYYVRARLQGWAEEYYDNKATRDAATPVLVTAGEDTPNINFTLAQTGYISGTVYRSDGVTPLATAALDAYDSVTGEWVNDGSSGAYNGRYYINVPPGTYRIKVTAPGYVMQWYQRAETFTAATTVPVIDLKETPNINFTLLTGMEVTTNEATEITTTTARLNGELTSLAAQDNVAVSFEFGTTTGSYTRATASQAKSSAGDFHADLSGLDQGTTYHYRAKAVAGGELAYGVGKTFTTIDATAPIISLVTSDNITFSGVTVAWATDEAATSLVEYGLTEEYGSVTTEDTSLVTSHSVKVTSLEAGKTYHYRVISKDASNNEAVSEDGTFTTGESPGEMPSWAWAIIGLAAVAVVGGVAYFIRGRPAKRQQP